MAAFAAANPTNAATWVSGFNGEDEPNFSTEYLSFLAENTLTWNKWRVNLLGFTRMEYFFSKIVITAAGMMPETVTLRKDAPCRFVETWLLFNPFDDDESEQQSAERIDVLYKGSHYRYAAYNVSANCGLVYIIAFRSGITTPQKTQYGDRLVVVAIPDNVSSIQIGYYTSKSGTTNFGPQLYYYQLNQN